MITKYTMSGRVRDSDKIVSCTVSAPLGVSKEEFLKREDAFYVAFDVIRVTYTTERKR